MEIVETRDRMDDDAGQCRGIDRECGLGCRERDEPGAHPRSAFRRQPGGTRHHPAAGDQRVPARVFMAFEARPRKSVEPPQGLVGGRVGHDAVEHRLGDADLHEDDLAAMAASRQQQMARLLAEESDGRRRLWCDPANFAARPVDPARDIDRDDRQPAFGKRLDDRPRGPLDRARQPGAKDAIDDEGRAVERRRRQRLDRRRASR